MPVVGTGIADAVRHHQPLFILVALAGLAPLFFRRRHPEAALATALLAGLGMRDEVVLLLPAGVVLYTVASTRTGRITAAAVLASLGAVVLHAPSGVSRCASATSSVRPWCTGSPWPLA